MANAGSSSQAGHPNLAARARWVRPPVERVSSAFRVIRVGTGGRGGAAGPRPAVVANDCDLTDDRRLWLLTGPNSGRQFDLLQAERADRAAGPGRCLKCRRPEAHIGVVTGCFRRGRAAAVRSRPRRSTFMVEMVENRDHPEPRDRLAPLVILVPRSAAGTATFVRAAIAWVDGRATCNDREPVPRPVRHPLSRLIALGREAGPLSLPFDAGQRSGRATIVFLHEVAAGTARTRSLRPSTVARGWPALVLPRWSTRAEQVLEAAGS